MKKVLPVAALLALTTKPALAHVGVGSTMAFAAGVAHPMTGIDHVCVMVAVGLWAALKGGRALWIWPAAFVTAMLMGAALGMAHVPLPNVQEGILASVVVLGLLVALNIDLPVWTGALLIVAFAVLHGHAHGSEATVTVGGAEYMAGFALATASLHALGVGFALLTERLRAQALVRVAGLACALLGIGLVSGV
jgi:urease accessory protein